MINIIIIKYSNKYYEWISETSDSTIKHIYKIYIHIMISRTLKLLLYKNPNMQALNIYSYFMFENNWPRAKSLKEDPHNTSTCMWGREGFEMGTLGG